LSESGYLGVVEINHFWYQSFVLKLEKEHLK